MSEGNGLPKGWEMVSLGEVTEICTGKLDVNAETPNGQFPFFTCAQEIHRIDDFAFDTEAVLLAGNGNFNVKWFKGRFNAYQRTYVISPIGVEGKYLYYQIEHMLPAITKGNRGSTIRFIRLGDVSGCPMRIAPINEQHRIVAKLEELFSDLDAGVAALKRVRGNLKRYRASVLKSAVEGRLTEGWRRRNEAKETASELLSRILKERRRRWEEGQLAAYAAKGKKPPKGWKEKYKEPAGVDTGALPGLPEGWCWASVEQLARVGTGTTPRRGVSKFWDGGTIPWVTSTAVNEPNVTRGNELVTEAALKETNLTPYPAGTLIIALYGEGKTRGKVSQLLIEATINQALAALQMEGSAGEVREYLKLFLLGDYEKLRRGSAGGVQPNLNLGLVKRIAVPLPPLVEQQMIAAEVEEKMSVVDQVSSLVKGSHARTGRLRQAVLKRAFEGSLVAQSQGESTDGLLKGIGASKER